jgi:hypothetical protein
MNTTDSFNHIFKFLKENLTFNDLDKALKDFSFISEDTKSVDVRNKVRRYVHSKLWAQPFLIEYINVFYNNDIISFVQLFDKDDIVYNELIKELSSNPSFYTKIETEDNNVLSYYDIKTKILMQFMTINDFYIIILQKIKE